MSHDYDRREAARRPIKLTDDEKKALTGVLGNLRGLDFSTFELDKLKPNIVRSLSKKGIIYSRYEIRLTPRGYNVAERLP